MKKNIFALFTVGMLFFGCLKFYILSPVYVLSDIFYFMPKSAFDDCDGECKKGVVWFPITRIQHRMDCN